MTRQISRQSNPPSLRLLLVDDDRIFGLGLRTGLQEANISGVVVLAQVTSTSSALEAITRDRPDLIVMELGISTNSPQDLTGLEFCQVVKSQYSSLPIFLLTAKVSSQELIAAYNLGVNGYAAKGTELDNLIPAWFQIIQGRNYWQTIEKRPGNTAQTPGKNWLTAQRQMGMREVDNSLREVEQALAQSKLPLIDWLFWNGRRRELKFAKWLINQILPVEFVILDNNRLELYRDNELPQVIGPTSALTILPQTQTLEQQILDLTLAKIQAGVENLTGLVLEIDILRSSTKKELLYLVDNQVIQSLNTAKFSQIEEKELLAQRNIIVREIWQDCCFKFIAKYYSRQLIDQSILLELILKELSFIEEDLLHKIPFVEQILEYYVQGNPLIIEGASYDYESSEAQNFFELIFQNLIIQVANAVMLTVLNNFLEQEMNQPQIYGEAVKSSRDIAQFRNRLSWKYRREKYLEEPQHIFEDHYRIFYFNGKGIVTTLMKSSRKIELRKLEGIRWLVTLGIEARDAIAPGLKAVIDGLGKGLVYLLTEVIGRGIGLIGKGIIQGVGNSLQETRYRRDNPRGK